MLAPSAEAGTGNSSSQPQPLGCWPHVPDQPALIPGNWTCECHSDTTNGHQASTLVVLDWLVNHGERLVSPGSTGPTDCAQDLKSSRHNPGLSCEDVVVELHLPLRPFPPRKRLWPSVFRGTHVVLIDELYPRTSCLRGFPKTMIKMRRCAHGLALARI